ncbi:MAG: hypothetical protein Q8Q09_17090, partial [Deltaproteobacteria bacterium]|nr:hypothetical protein [Deltaproteobacteria bacterium]
NLLVGGLLTIAAPVLAMLFKDRVDKEIKAKALQYAPDVVRTVARKLEPELLAAIDRCCEKLSDFVTNASEELRRSLIEILTDTKRMLAVESMDKGAAIAETDAKLAQVAALHERVGLLRSGLWERAATGTSAEVVGGEESFEIPTMPKIEG